jgi:hypothetical protein
VKRSFASKIKRYLDATLRFALFVSLRLSIYKREFLTYDEENEVECIILLR